MNTQISNGSLIINGLVIPAAEVSILNALNEMFDWHAIPEISKRLKQAKSYNNIYSLLTRLRSKGIVLYKGVPITPKKIKAYWSIDQSIKDQINQQQHATNTVIVSKDFVEQAGQAMAFLKQVKSMHLSLVNTLKDIDSRNYSGLLLDDKVIAAMEIVFPNDSSLIKPADLIVDNFVVWMMAKMKKFQEEKEMFAISGAMRYPWSQEARITAFNSSRIKPD